MTTKLLMVLLFCFGGLIGHLSAQSQWNEWLCEVADSTAPGTLHPLVPDPYGWLGAPNDLRGHNLPFLFTDKEYNSAYELWWSKSTHTLYILPIANMTGDEDGEQHDICKMFSYQLPINGDE